MAIADSDSGRRILVVASGNAGKLREFGRLLSALKLDVRPQSDWDVPDAVEDGVTFVENALIKAQHASRQTGEWALADDSGLVVPALNGAPGVHSARYSGAHGDSAANNAKLLEQMQPFSGDDRVAFFHCAMVMVRAADDPVPLLAQASWWGQIAEQPAGSEGFGYDPLFMVPHRGCTSAELPAMTKNRISHRALATAALLKQLKV